MFFPVLAVFFDGGFFPEETKESFVDFFGVPEDVLSDRSPSGTSAVLGTG